jgi:lipopolysaccharide export system permease protein
MRLLDRYLLRELLLPFGFCLGGFLIFWSAGELVGELPELQKAKLRGLDVAQYCLAQVPEKMLFLLPVALLLALLYALTQHARNNEITAMRSAGISLWRLAAPYLVMGFALSWVLFAVNELVVPRAALQADEIKTRRVSTASDVRERTLVRNFGFSNVRERREWQVGIFDLPTGELRQLRIAQTQPDRSLSLLYAERAFYTNGGWALINVKELRRGPEVGAALAPGLYTNYLFKTDFTETPDQIRSEVKISAGLTGSVRKARRADIPIADLRDYLRLHPQLKPSDEAWLYTKLHGRYAAPWTCFVVVLIALPFGAASGRRNVFVGVASSIFIFFAFFVVSAIGLAFGTAGWLPPWLAAWLPNLVFSGAALSLIARVR